MSLFNDCAKCKKEFNAEDVLFNSEVLEYLCGKCTDLLNWQIGEICCNFFKPTKRKIKCDHNSETVSCMKWQILKKDEVSDYSWIILGYWVSDYENMAWQIGRKISGKFEFWGDTNGGPYADDAVWPFDPNESTHWIDIQVPWTDDELPNE